MTKTTANPFYLLLLACSFAFAVTALAYAVVPQEHQPAWLWTHGWQILLAEVAAIIVFGLVSMGLDRARQQGIRDQKSEVRGQKSEAQT